MSGAEAQAPGRVVSGRYRLESQLGRGGMGVVWLAVDTLIERQVALKELRAPAGVTGEDEASFVERALREARNAGRLNHPGVVAVHDVIAPAGDDPAVYIVMEYVAAPTLAEVLDQQGPLPAPRVAAMGVGILDALAAAHAMGIVHRDVKPGNVLVGDEDRVKLTDFGIALAAEDTRLTRSGVIGTHAYMAPESFDTGQVGPAADLWALGATLFHAVAGRAPFERETTTATLRAILFEDPPAPPCGPPLATAITGLLTRAVDRRLTSQAANQLLQQATSQPVATTPTTSGAGQPGWQAQATSLHRPPTPPPRGPATGPGGPPSPYVTTQLRRPPMAPTTGAPPAAPPRPNRTPWIIGGAVAAAAALVFGILLASSGGGSDSGESSEADGSSEASSYTDADHDQFVDECASQTSDVPTVGAGDDLCECAWNAVVQTVPYDIYRDAVAAGEGSPDTLPPAVQDEYSGALAACLPTSVPPP